MVGDVVLKCLTMSKNETPLTMRYWRSVGGSLVLEFPAVKRTENSGQRLIDGVIVFDGKTRIAGANDVQIEDKDIIVVQTKAHRLGMYLMGQALFSIGLMKRFKPKSIRSVAVCTRHDEELEELLRLHNDIEVVVYDD